MSQEPPNKVTCSSTISTLYQWMEHSEEGALKYQHKNWSPSEIDNLSKKKVHQMILRKITRNQYTSLSEKEQIISAKFVKKFGPSEQICGFIEEND